MSLKIDKNLCLNCGLCESISPSTFKINAEDGKVIVLNSEANNTEVDKAVQSCPVCAISRE